MQAIFRVVCALAVASAAATLIGCGSGGGAVGTFDNTGGPPPTGTSIAFEPISLALDPFCNSQLGGGTGSVALLARAEADIPVINGNEPCTSSLRSALAPSLASLSADQAIVILHFVFGGFIPLQDAPIDANYEIAGVVRDNLVVRPWIVLLDPTYGASNPGPVPANALLSGLIAIRVNGVTGANAVELVIRKANPNFPREPNVPNF